MPSSLLISQGLEQGKQFRLDRAQVLIGRDVSSDVCVRDIEASRKHCRITQEGSGYFVADLGSSNGTYVNGTRIKRAALSSGDRIRVGSTEITFKQATTDDATAPSRLDVLTSAASPATLTAVSPELSELPGSRLDDESTYYNLVTDEVEASRRFVQVGNDLRFLYNASLATSCRTAGDHMLDEILVLILEWIAADRACVMLKDQDEPRFRLKHSNIALDCLIERTFG